MHEQLTLPQCWQNNVYESKYMKNYAIDGVFISYCAIKYIALCCNKASKTTHNLHRFFNAFHRVNGQAFEIFIGFSTCFGGVGFGNNRHTEA